MKRHYDRNYRADWNPNKRFSFWVEYGPFLGLLAGLGALVGGLIWVMERFLI